MISENNFFSGQLTIYQHVNGYRFSIDPILLAHHVEADNRDTILDIGTGCGIIPMTLNHRFDVKRIYGVEIQNSLFEIAEKNIKKNKMEKNIQLLLSDIKDMTQKAMNGPADIIVTNPPYQKPGSGRINPESEKALARHEIKINLKTLLKKTRSLLKNKGKFYIIYPANRASELIFEMESFKITPKQLRFVHSFKDSEATMVICQGIMNGNTGVEIMPPLIIYEDKKIYTKEVLSFIS